MTVPAPDIPLLAGLPPKDRERIVSHLKHRTYAPGDTVVREGEQALNLFIVISGRARVEREGVGAVSTVGPGDFFGEIALIERHGRTATVVAEEPLSCYLVPAWEFRSLLNEYPQMALPMLLAFIARMHAAERHSG
jgi:CRP-like cAMP-binding protein